MLKHLAKGSLAYGGANLLQKLVPLLVIPLITASFGKQGLKVYDVSFVYAYLFSWLVILGQDNAASILYFSNKDGAARKKLLKHGLLIQLAFFVLVAAVFLPLKNILASLIFPHDTVIADYWLKALFIIPGHILLNYVLNILLWQERKRSYILLCGIQACLALGGVLLTVLFDGGIDGIFLSLVCATTITSLTGLAMVSKSIDIKPVIDKELTKRLLLLGLPFALTSFFQQLVPSIDRYFLLQYNYGDQLAQYALGAKIGGLVSIVTSAFVLAFTPYSMSRIFEKNGEEQISALFRIVAPALLLCVPVVLLFRNVLVNLFADGSYNISARLLPLFFMGWVFDLFFYFSVLGVYKTQKAHLVLLFFIAGITLIALLNFFLVPVYGVYGAAAAFCITKVFLFFLPLVALKKFFRLSVSPVSFFSFLAASLLCSYLIYQLAFYQSVLLIALAITVTFFYLNSAVQRAGFANL